MGAPATGVVAAGVVDSSAPQATVAANAKAIAAAIACWVWYMSRLSFVFAGTDLLPEARRSTLRLR
jgi:hypothetical protein